MRIAVISDIHGNGIALDAVLDDLQQPVDQIVCLGDAVQGGPQPAHVVSRLRALHCPAVMGNADAWLLSGEDSGAEAINSKRRRTMEDVRAWSLAQLSAQNRAFIAAFPPTCEIALGSGATLLADHGSPCSFDDIILPILRRSSSRHSGAATWPICIAAAIHMCSSCAEPMPDRSSTLTPAALGWHIATINLTTCFGSIFGRSMPC